MSQQTLSQILDDRRKTHGDFTEHARITQNIKAMMQNEPTYGNLSAVQRESLEMIAHKIGRVLAGNPNTADHWDDMAGYATLVAKRIPSPPAETQEEQQGETKAA